MGLKIKLVRIKRGLTQKELADKIGTSTTTIMRAENDKVDMRISTLRRIAKALDVSITELLED